MQLLKYLESKNKKNIDKILSDVSEKFNSILPIEKIILSEVKNTTIFTDQRPINISLPFNFKKTFFKKYCYFKPNMNPEQDLGTIAISANILKKEIPENTESFLIELLGKRNYQYNSHTTDKEKQEIIIKYLLYHELAHAYQHNLYSQNQNILSVDNWYHKFGQVIGNTEYYYLSCYELTDVQEKDVSTQAIHYLMGLSQEMYSDIFALVLLTQDYGFDNNIVDDLYDIIKYSRQNNNKDNNFIYSTHFTSHALNFFNKKDLKCFIKERQKSSNMNLENILHTYVSNIVSQALYIFLQDYIKDANKDYFNMTNKEETLKVFKEILNNKQVKVLNKDTKNHNTEITKKLKNVKLRQRSFNQKLK